jgi:hypothetical protein
VDFEALPRKTPWVTFERLRDRTLATLTRHYAADRLRLGTLEHRVQETITARSPADLSRVLWDLPRFEDHVWAALRTHIPARWQRRPCTRLSVRTAPEVVLTAQRDPQSWLLGRSRRCDVVLPDAAISRRHALISVRGGRWSVRDLGSTNGVQVNDRHVETAVIWAGDNLTLADTVVCIAR